MEPNSLEVSPTCNLAGIMRSIVSIGITRQDRALRTRGLVNGDRRPRRGGSSIRTRQAAGRWQVVIFEHSLSSAFHGPKAKSQKPKKKTRDMFLVPRRLTHLARWDQASRPAMVTDRARSWDWLAHRRRSQRRGLVAQQRLAEEANGLDSGLLGAASVVLVPRVGLLRREELYQKKRAAAPVL